METNEHLKKSFERIEKILTRSPRRGRKTAHSRTRLRDGLTCDVEEGPWKLVADMEANAGGAGAGPTPGVYARAALGSCLAINYAFWAAKRDVPLGNVEVAIEADFDSGAMFGTAEVPPGYSEVRCFVTVESSAPEPEVRRMLDEADAHSPYFDVFTRAQKVERNVRVVSKKNPA